MEAMACGRTVARRNAPRVTKLLNGEEQAGGAVVPRENPKILATALSRLLDGRDLAVRLGEATRARVVEQ